MVSKSKAKGKSWERDVCNFLSELYHDSFIRVPNSGAYVGGKNEYRRDYLTEEQIKLSRGDIIPPVNFPYFLAECKNYADFPFHQLLAKTSIAQLDNWIDQVEHDVTSDDDLWLLFIKITRKGTYVLFNRNIYDPYVHNNLGPGMIEFDYGADLPFNISSFSYLPDVGDLFIFPAWLKHHVFAFKSDVERISVSGNINFKYKEN